MDCHAPDSAVILTLLLKDHLCENKIFERVKKMSMCLLLERK